VVGRLFASFFGAAMIAASFAYYNYKFAEFNFIDFSEWQFYEKRDFFKPSEDEYLVIIHNSKDLKSLNYLKNINSKIHVLLIDYYQKMDQIPDKNGTTQLKSGTNTMLKIIQRFNIYDLPSAFYIKKQNNKTLYKQNSDIEVWK
jgi:hypothetical protein